MKMKETNRRGKRKERNFTNDPFRLTVLYNKNEQQGRRGAEQGWI